MAPLLTFDGELVAGTVVDRPNRFVVRVRFDAERADLEPERADPDVERAGLDPERAYLADPGALRGTIEPGNTVLCSPVEDSERATDYDAIAAVVDGVHASLRAALANDLFANALAADALPQFSGYEVDRREPPLPEHGRTDFLLATPDGDPAYVEVKSCTHVEDGVVKFPDRPTERGRRHLRSLDALRADGIETHVVFVVQRPDADVLRPFRSVDPEFADVLETVARAGVGVHACVVEFTPPDYCLRTPDLPVDLDARNSD